MKRASAPASFVTGAVIAGLCLLPWTCQAARSEIKNGQFYVDGAPFYVRGVGYAPWRPHQHPGVSYADTNRRWTEMDFERIKAAHFNTVRTWDALEGEELALADKNGLMVLQGIWLDPHQDFSDPRNQDSCVAQVEAVARASKDAGNILGYLIMTEPSPQAVTDTGEQDTLQFFRRLKRSIQAIDPRPVSMDSWFPLAFLDQNAFDFTTVNLFAFWPKPITDSLGYPAMVRWFVDRWGIDRPLIVGETGGYSVSQASVTAAGGYGGLTEYEQSLKDLESLRETIEGHAAGSVLVSWIDTWHYPSDPDTHDNEPWEWDGILGIETDSPKDMDGVPRQIYRDVTAYNEALILEPKANHFYGIGEKIPIDVTTSDEITAVRYSVNDGEWTSLEGSAATGWQGFFKLPPLARRWQKLTIEARDQSDVVVSQKDVSFLAAMQPESVTLDSKSAGKNHQSFGVKLVDGKYHPIGQRKMIYGCFYPVSGVSGEGSLMTDDKGQGTFTCPVKPASGDPYVFVAAGTINLDRLRAGDMKIFRLGS